MKVTQLNFGARVQSLSQLVPMVSESAATPIRLKYMGNVSVELDGNDDWEATVDKGEAYELVPAANARGKVAIVLKIERKREFFYVSDRAKLMQILAGTKFPKKMDLDNLLYATGKGVTKGQGLVEVGTIAEDILDTTTHKWFLASGIKMYMDSNKRHYFSFDLKTPMETYLPKTKVARLKASFKATAQKDTMTSQIAKAAGEKSKSVHQYDGGPIDPKYVGDPNFTVLIGGQVFKGTELALDSSGNVYHPVANDDPIANALSSNKRPAFKNMTLAQVGNALLEKPRNLMYVEAALAAHAEDLRSMLAVNRSVTAWKELGFTSKQGAIKQLAEIEGTTVRNTVPVTDPTVGPRSTVIPTKTIAESDYGFLAVTPHAQHAKDSWVVYAPTRAALTRQLDVLYVAAGEPMAKAGKVELYKVVRQSPLVQQIAKRAVAMSTAELKAKATFVRMVSFAAPVAVDDEQDERPWTDIDPDDINVSWSEFDPAETRLAVAKLFNEGFFSAKLKPRPTTKGLVFDIVGGRAGRDEVYGAVRRVYQWLHNIGVSNVKVSAKWAPTKALIDFKFPALTAEAKESIRLLREKPPVIGAPLYTIDTQKHRTFQIYSADKNSGQVFMYPVRNAQPLTNEPTPVLYSKVQRITE